MLESEGPRYHRSAEATAVILNFYLHSDLPKAELYGKILYVILDSMYQAQEDLGDSRLEPSNN